MAQLPDRINRLRELANDLWWSWTPDAREVFRQLDYPLWRLTAHNPVRMLQTDDAGRRSSGRSPTRSGSRYYDRAHGRPRRRARGAQHLVRAANARSSHGKSIAYFSAEFALHQSLPIYAGGLGVLAGDHCKEASDLGVPLIGVGFMYPQGYFHQSADRRTAGRRSTTRN